MLLRDRLVGDLESILKVQISSLINSKNIVGSDGKKFFITSNK